MVHVASATEKMRKRWRWFGRRKEAREEVPLKAAESTMGEDEERAKSIAQFDFSKHKERESRRREEMGADRKNDCFFSHCWRGRDEAIANAKWDINERLTRPAGDGGAGLRMWCDFLDLQASGPVAWRKEIEDGIRAAGKVVAMVDIPYLHSFNCLQEVAMAQRMGKPIVFVVLDKRALDLVTSADHGAKALWDDAPPPDAGTKDRLSAFEGASWGAADGSDPFDFAKLAKCLERVSNVNFCMAKMDDFANRGKEAVEQAVLEFVRVDLPYVKEHARLLSIASAPNARLYGDELKHAQAWLVLADAENQEPAPTKEMRDLIKNSGRARQRTLAIVGGVMFLLFLASIGGLVVSVASARDAQNKERVAQEALARAIEAEEKARASLNEAETARALAVDARDRAEAEAQRANVAEQNATAASARAIEQRQIAEDQTEQAFIEINRTRVVLARTSTNDRTIPLYERFRFGVTAIQIATDTVGLTGNTLFSAYTDLSKSFQEYTLGTLLQTLPPLHKRGEEGMDPEIVMASDWHPDGKLVAYGGTGGSSLGRRVSVSSPQTGEVLQRLPSMDVDTEGLRISSIAFSPDGSLLAVGTEHSSGEPAPIVPSLRVFSTATWQLKYEIRSEAISTGGVKSIAWSPDATRLALGVDRAVRLHVAETGAFDRSLTIGSRGDDVGDEEGRHRRLRQVADSEDEYVQIEMVAFSPDGEHVAAAGMCAGATACTDASSLVWSVRTGRVLNTYRISMGAASVSFSPDGAYVAFGSAGTLGRASEVIVYSVATGEMAKLRGSTDTISSVKFSPNGEFLAAAGNDRIIRLFEANWQENGTLNWSSSPRRALTGHGNSVLSLAWSPDGKALLSTGLQSSTGIAEMNLWAGEDSVTQMSLAQLGRVRSVRWSPDAKLLAVAGGDSTVYLYNAANAKLVHSLQGHSSSVNDVAWSPSGHRLASVGRDKVMIVWNLATYARVQEVLHPDAITAVRYSPDVTVPRIASSALDGVVRIFDVTDSARVLHELQVGAAREVVPLAWSPDGSRVVSTSRKRMQLWDAATGELLLTKDQSAGLESSEDEYGPVAWSPDGRWIAVGSEEGGVFVYHASTLTRALVEDTGTNAHRQVEYRNELDETRRIGVVAIAWSPDSLVVASAGGDKVIQSLFEIATDSANNEALKRRSSLGEKSYVVEDDPAVDSFPAVDYAPANAGLPLLAYAFADAKSLGGVKVTVGTDVAGVTALATSYTGGINFTAQILDLIPDN